MKMYLVYMKIHFLQNDCNYSSLLEAEIKRVFHSPGKNVLFSNIIQLYLLVISYPTIKAKPYQKIKLIRGPFTR